MMHFKRYGFFMGLAVMALAGSAMAGFALADMALAASAPEPEGEDNPVRHALQAVTYHTQTGNRTIDGTGTFPNVEVRSVSAQGGFVNWVIGQALPDGIVRFQFTTDTGALVEVDYDLAQGTETIITDQTPPTGILWHHPAEAGFNYPREEVSPLSHPVILPERIAYITGSGDLMIRAQDGTIIAQHSINALPDARLVVSASGTIAVYGDATNQRYVHGVLGDDLEAAALAVYDLDSGDRLSRIVLEGDEVFEGLSPIWADVDGDGVEELITTVSSGAQGAQIRVYTPEGALLATGDAIGRGGRWRHQLAWGTFGPDNAFNLVDVLTPHIGGVVEFYRYDGAGRLEIVASKAGYTSHVIGTRNLDMAVAGDFNGDGQLELAIPDQSRTAIAGVQRSAESSGGVDEVWRFELDGARVISNLAAVHVPEFGLALAAGLDDGTLRVWLPAAP